MKRFTLLFLTLTSACGKNGSTPAKFEMPVLASSVSRATASAPAADVSTLAQNNNAFASALYGQLANGNLVFSPFSISLALAMAEAGSATTTETAMLQTLDISLSDAALHPAYNALCDTLQVTPESGNTQVQIANTVVVDQTLAVSQPYLDLLAEDYGAKVRVADFTNAASQATSDINQWVSDRTNGKINPLFANTLDASTRLLLVNAIYLNAAWATPFLAADTTNQSFITASGTISTPTMQHSGSYAYAVTEDYTAVQLPYASSTLALLLVMPSGDMASFGASLDAAEWQSIVSALSMGAVGLSIPKFKIAGAAVDLVQPLTALGMGQAFDDNADFSRMTGEKVAITHVVHRAFINVDEAGTEAAAATGASVGPLALQAPNTALQFDHPFLFALRDTQTSSILFLGQVVSPAD